MVEEDQDVKRLEILQSMIDIYAERLVDLRTKCFTGNELTQNEIRTLEVNEFEILYYHVIIYVTTSTQDRRIVLVTYHKTKSFHSASWL